MLSIITRKAIKNVSKWLNFKNKRMFGGKRTQDKIKTTRKLILIA